MAIYFTQKGSFTRTEKFFNFLLNRNYLNILDRYGRMGVAALQSATPKDTGRTADSWNYEIIDDGDTVRLIFTNDNVNKGQNIAILLQYGHGTGTGGYVEGRDFINPVIQPIFDDIADGCFREVTAK